MVKRKSKSRRARLRERAERGDAKACYSLACDLWPDAREAAKYLSKAAELGHLEARSVLGHWYAVGRGVRRDVRKGVRMSWEAARQGDQAAIYTLDYFTHHSLPVLKEIHRLRRGAAAQGDGAAMYMLGRAYDEGHGVARSPARSFEWFKKAAESGYIGAAWRIVDQIDERGSPTERRIWLHWLRRDAEAGDAVSQLYLGLRLYSGAHLRRSVAEAMLWYRKAAGQGDADAWTFLGHMHREGEGVRRSWIRALECYRRAATGGSGIALYWLVEYYSGRCGRPRNGRALAAWVRRAEAMAPENPSVCFFLGEHYCNEEEPSTDPKRAVHWLRVGAAQGDEECLVELGALYHDGIGVRRDHERAVALYRRGVGDVGGRGEFLLGCCYLDGHGVRRDRRRARSWFRRAVREGSEEAAKELAKLDRSASTRRGA